MRRLLLALALVLTIGAGCASAQVTLTQVVGNCAIGSTTCTITPSVAITAGHALIAVVGGTLSNNHLTSVTATGHTFTVLDSGFSGGSLPWIGDAYECNAASGSPVFTFTTPASGGGSSTAYLYEVQGNATTSCIDGHFGQAQTTPGTTANAITSGTAITVAQNGEFFIGGTFAGGGTVPTYTAGTNVAWTNIQHNSGNTMAIEQFAQATAASLNAEFTQSANRSAATLIVGILPSGGGGGGSPAQPPCGLRLLGVGCDEALR